MKPSPMNRPSRTVIFRNLLFALLIMWVLTFIIHLRLPQLSVVYYISLGLAFLFALVGTISIIYHISSWRLSRQRNLVVQTPPVIQRPTQPPPTHLLFPVTQRPTQPPPTQLLLPVTQRPPTQFLFPVTQRPTRPHHILRLLSKTSVFFTYLTLVAIFLAFNVAFAYLRVNSCPLIKDKRINVNGSTALAPLIRDVANEYQQKCFGANVSVNTGSSLNGLHQVEKGSADVGASDVFADLYQNPNLKDYQVAVVVFALVVNDSVDITNLTTDEVKRIYSGNIINWHDAGNSKDLDVVLISRPPTSHTRWAFEKYVLGGGIETISGPQALVSDREDIVASSIQEQPGAIGYVPLYYANKYHLKILSIDNNNPQNTNLVKSDIYKFWNIEHMYTRGLPDSPVKDFIGYMFSNNAKHIISRDGYLDPTEFSRAVLITHVSDE